MLVSDVITSALIQAGKVPMGGGVPASWLIRGLTDLNTLLQQWAAEGLLLHALTTTTVTLVGGTPSYTIGDTGTIAVRRPVELVDARLTTGVNQFRSLRVYNAPFRYRDYTTLPSGVPTEVYYDPQVVLGTMTFYPTPDAAYAVDLSALVSVAPFTTTSDTIPLPPEYEAALTANLGVYFLSLPTTINGDSRSDPLLIERARMTKSALLTNNSQRLLHEVGVDPAVQYASQGGWATWRIAQG